MTNEPEDTPTHHQVEMSWETHDGLLYKVAARVDEKQIASAVWPGTIIEGTITQAARELTFQVCRDREKRRRRA